MDASAPKKKSRPLGLIAVVALVLLLIVIDMRRRSAENQLAQLSMKYEQVAGNQDQNREAAQQIVEKVRKIYALPADIEPTVATIVDVNELRKRNVFYNKAENGDYLVVTPERAILYREKTNVILDVVPVQIQPAAAAQTSSAPAPRARVAPTPTPKPAEPTEGEAASAQ